MQLLNRTFSTGMRKAAWAQAAAASDYLQIIQSLSHITVCCKYDGLQAILCVVDLSLVNKWH